MRKQGEKLSTPIVYKLDLKQAFSHKEILVFNLRDRECKLGSGMLCRL